MRERNDVFAGHQLVPDWLAQPIERRRIDDRPVARGQRVNQALRLELASQQRALGMKCVSVRIARASGSATVLTSYTELFGPSTCMSSRTLKKCW